VGEKCPHFEKLKLGNVNDVDFANNDCPLKEECPYYKKVEQDPSLLKECPFKKTQETKDKKASKCPYVAFD
jgi:hypothetical protein